MSFPTHETDELEESIENILFAQDKLFVYGIFLGEKLRNMYGMSNPRYGVIRGLTTILLGGNIVGAYRVENEDIALTGLIVDVNPTYWQEIDDLERGYTRTEAITESGERVWIYIKG